MGDLRWNGEERGDYHATFLYNVSTGQSVRIGLLMSWWGGNFSRDGETAAWIAPTAGAFELQVVKLNAANPRPRATRITLMASFYQLSDDGSRVVVIDRDGILTVYDVSTSASLGSARIPAGNYWLGNFVRPDLVRIYGYSNYRGAVRPTLIFEYDIARKVLTAAGEFPAPVYRVSYDRSLALIRQEAALEIRDARSGALLRSIPGHFRSVRYLRDGRIAAIGSSLQIFTREGEPVRDITLPKMEIGDVIGDATAGCVVLLVRQHLGTWSSAAVDIDRGTLLRVELGLRPMTFAGPRLLCYSKDGLVVWDPATGSKRIVAGPSPLPGQVF